MNYNFKIRHSLVLTSSNRAPCNCESSIIPSVPKSVISKLTVLSSVTLFCGERVGVVAERIWRSC